MSLSENNFSNLAAGSSLFINDLVKDKIVNLSSPFYLQPLTTPAGKPLSYYDRPIAITTEETKGFRKISRLFSQLAKAGLVPEVSVLNLAPNLAIEWGKADAMRLAFLPVANSFVHVKEFSFGKNDMPDIKTAIKRVYVTGTCLFGRQSVTGITTTGKIINPTDPYLLQQASANEDGCISALEFSDKLHSYEVMGGLSRNNLLNQIKADRVYFNVPVAPYIFYAKDMIAENLMAPDLLQIWVDQIELRAEKLIAYEKFLCQGEVIPVDPLYRYRDVICDPQMTLETFAEFLSTQDVWWKTYLEKMPTNRFSDLGYASYVRLYYDLLGDKNCARHLIAVEDQTEMRIFLEVKKLIESGILPKPNERSAMIGFYPFTPLVFPDAEGKADAVFLSERSNFEGVTDLIFHSCQTIFDPQMIERARIAYADGCNNPYAMSVNVPTLNNVPF